MQFPEAEVPSDTQTRLFDYIYIIYAHVFCAYTYVYIYIHMYVYMNMWATKEHYFFCLWCFMPPQCERL